MNTRVNALYENKNSKQFLNKYKSRSRNILEGILPTYISTLKAITEADMIHLVGTDFEDTCDNIVTMSMCETINLFDDEVKHCVLNEELDEKTIIDYINEKMSMKKKAAIGAGGLAAAGGAAYGLKKLGGDVASGEPSGPGTSDMIKHGARKAFDYAKDKAGKIPDAAREFGTGATTGDEGGSMAQKAGAMIGQNKKVAAGIAAGGALAAGYKGYKAIKNRAKKKNENK